MNFEKDIEFTKGPLGSDKLFVKTLGKGHHGPPPPKKHMNIFKKGEGSFIFSHDFDMDIQKRHNIYQSVNDDLLELLVQLPGINKSTLKVRSKPIKVSINSEIKEEYIGKIAPPKINLVIDLEEEVIPEQANASYKDGILKITFPLANPGHKINIKE